jgi:ankyrin repeat protein
MSGASKLSDDIFDALYSALERNDVDAIGDRLTAECVTSVNVCHSSRFLLNAAARSGNVALVKRVLDLGANVMSIEDWFGYTALHDAASVGDVAVVKALLAAGADANARSHYGFAPLDVAMNHGRDAVATLLEPLTLAPDAAVLRRRRRPAKVADTNNRQASTSDKKKPRQSKKQQRDAVVVPV